MTPRDHARRAVLLGEVVHRPHRVALDLEARGEREEVERPLIAVHVLRGFTGTDLDDLRQVQLVGRCVIAQHAIERSERGGVRGDLTEGTRPREQRPGSPGVEARELVCPRRGLPEERFEIFLDAIHQRVGSESLDHDTTRRAQSRLDIVDARIRRDPRNVKLHRATLPRYSTGTSWRFTRLMSSRGLNGLNT